MKPMMLADGHWFDADTAESWRTEDTGWSRMDVWAWEVLWRTKTGRYVLDKREMAVTGAVVDNPLDDLSANSLKERSFIDAAAVPGWFAMHDMDLPDDIVVSDEFKNLEI